MDSENNKPVTQINWLNPLSANNLLFFNENPSGSNDSSRDVTIAKKNITNKINK